MKSPSQNMFIVALGLALGVAILFGLAGMSFLRSVFLGVNVATFVWYGYDKYMAASGGWRVPEFVLHALAAAGGSPAALVAQIFFRHKTRDSRFRRVFFAIVAVQVVLACLYMRYGG